MEINQRAALKAVKEMKISAPIDKVWSRLTEIDLWKEWQPDVSESKLEGDIDRGAKFYWKVKGLDIHSVIQEYEPKTHIAWSGKSFGMNAIHRWVLQAEGENTHVSTEESLEGWVPRLIKITDPKFLEKTLTDALTRLKSVSE